MKSRLERFRNRVHMIAGVLLCVFCNINNIDTDANIYGLLMMVIFCIVMLRTEKRVIISLDSDFPEHYKCRLKVKAMLHSNLCICYSDRGDIQITKFIEV